MMTDDELEAALARLGAERERFCERLIVALRALLDENCSPETYAALEHEAAAPLRACRDLYAALPLDRLVGRSLPRLDALLAEFQGLRDQLLVLAASSDPPPYVLELLTSPDAAFDALAQRLLAPEPRTSRAN